MQMQDEAQKGFRAKIGIVIKYAAEEFKDFSPSMTIPTAHRRLFDTLKRERTKPKFNRTTDFAKVPALLTIPRLLLLEVRSAIEEKLPNPLHQAWFLQKVIEN